MNKDSLQTRRVHRPRVRRRERRAGRLRERQVGCFDSIVVVVVLTR